jgi:hypothetical protein
MCLLKQALDYGHHILYWINCTHISKGLLYLAVHIAALLLHVKTVLLTSSYCTGQSVHIPFIPEMSRAVNVNKPHIVLAGNTHFSFMKLVLLFCGQWLWIKMKGFPLPVPFITWFDCYILLSVTYLKDQVHLLSCREHFWVCWPGLFQVLICSLLWEQQLLTSLEDTM